MVNRGTTVTVNSAVPVFGVAPEDGFFSDTVTLIVAVPNFLPVIEP